VEIGGPCPPGAWPAGLPPANVLYVEAGAAPGGDGSIAAPYDSITFACARSSPGLIVALAKGTFVEDVELDGSCTITGACALETRIVAASTSTHASTIHVASGSVELRRIGVACAGHAIRAGSRAVVTLEGVAV